MKPYYEADGVTIYHGKAEDVLPTLPGESVGGVVTSPPYNQGDMSGGYANLEGGYDEYRDEMPHAEYVTWQRTVLAECWRITTPDGAIFYNHKPRIRGGLVWLPLELNPSLPLRQIITWARPSGCNWSETHLMPLYEWVLLFAKPEFRFSKAASTLGDVWRIHHQVGRTAGHPAPFPLALADNAVRLIAESNTGPILDPFMGSGTALLAAKRAGRPCVGIELSERYCALAAERLGAAPVMAEDSLFGGES